MNDTVRIERPLCCRRHEDLGGRIKQDLLGNSVTVKTRVHDSSEGVAQPLLELTANLGKGSAD